MFVAEGLKAWGAKIWARATKRSFTGKIKGQMGLENIPPCTSSPHYETERDTDNDEIKLLDEKLQTSGASEVGYGLRIAENLTARIT